MVFIPSNVASSLWLSIALHTLHGSNRDSGPEGRNDKTCGETPQQYLACVDVTARSVFHVLQKEANARYHIGDVCAMCCNADITRLYLRTHSSFFQKDSYLKPGKSSLCKVASDSKMLKMSFCDADLFLFFFLNLDSIHPN